jgi:hypothetical protein
MILYTPSQKMYKMSALCCETCLNVLNKFWGNCCNFALLNVVNCFMNILFQSQHVVMIVGVHKLFLVFPKNKFAWV